MRKTFLFIGNRNFVLEEMIKADLEISAILVLKGSYLELQLQHTDLNYFCFETKEQLINQICAQKFEILISNGCPFILPVDDLLRICERCINIHPSLLPDLRGADPQPGSLLHRRDSGATCHEMDMGIDTGPIISQVKIPYSSNFDAAMLYQLTFLAEKKVFKDALIKNFEIEKKQRSKRGDIYYTFNEEDLTLKYTDTPNQIFQKIKAFSNFSKGAEFEIDRRKIKVYDCEIFESRAIAQMFGNLPKYYIALNYEQKLLLKYENIFIKLKDFDQSIDFISTGRCLFEKYDE